MFVENAGKDIANIGVPRADRFHVGDDALEQFGPLIQETKLAEFVILLGGESVDGLLDDIHLRCVSALFRMFVNDPESEI